MVQKDRLSDIIKMVRAEHKVAVSDLAKRYKVTTETIRRDLELLEKEGIVARTYGGAIAVQSAPVTSDYKVRAVKMLLPKQQSENLLHLFFRRTARSAATRARRCTKQYHTSDPGQASLFSPTQSAS